MKEIRNILLVGKTGSGKSALTNVLTGTNEFEEDNRSASVTKDFQVSEPFENNEIKYRVIDTPGFDNTSLLKKEVLEKIKERIDSVKEEGISQILFLIRDDNFSEKEKEVLNLLGAVLKNDVAECVTIIWNDFSEDKGECEENSESLIKKIKEVSNLDIPSNKLVHIGVPSIDIKGNVERTERKINFNKEVREVSRIKLLTFLQNNCQKSYKIDSSKITECIESIKISNNNFEREEIEMRAETLELPKPSNKGETKKNHCIFL